MNDRYLVKLKEYYEQTDREEILSRVNGCARRILTAICFRESSEISFVRARTMIMPAIGFYYSLFHMGTAMLYLEHSTAMKNFRNIGHRRLKNLIESKLVKRKLIDHEFLSVLERFQSMKGLIDSSACPGGIYSEYLTQGKGSQMYQDTGEAFHVALSLINRFGTEIERVSEFVSPPEQIPRIISAHLQNELYLAHLSEDDRKRITNFLILWRLIE